MTNILTQEEFKAFALKACYNLDYPASRLLDSHAALLARVAELEKELEEQRDLYEANHD